MRTVLPTRRMKINIGNIPQQHSREAEPSKNDKKTKYGQHESERTTMDDWTIEEKAAMFDEIASHYYNKNYGTFSKADMDLLMFSFFLDREIKKHAYEDGHLDYNSVSDYLISKELCITQQRVKALKVKKQLLYPIEYDWKISFAALLQNARYEKDSQKIIMSIPDPNLLIEIQNFVEEKGGYISTQFNSKILQIRIEYFIELVALVSDEESKKKIIKSIKEQIKKTDKNESIFDEKNIGKSLIDLAVNGTSIIANISSAMSNGNPILHALRLIIPGVAGDANL